MRTEISAAYELGRADLLVGLDARQRVPPKFMAPMRDLEIVEAAHEPERRAPARRVETQQVRAERELGAPIAVQGRNARTMSGECSLPLLRRGEREKSGGSGRRRPRAPRRRFNSEKKGLRPRHSPSGRIAPNGSLSSVTAKQQAFSNYRVR